MIARVIVDLALDKSFDYLIPKSMLQDIRVGSQVLAPFGKSQRSGYVVALAQESDYPISKLKALTGLVENRTRISQNLLKLGEWMADYYCCSQEQAVRTLLPGVVRKGKLKTRKEFVYYASDSAEEFIIVSENKKNAAKRRAIVQHLVVAGKTSASMLKKEFGNIDSALQTLLKSQIIGKESVRIEYDAFENNLSILSDMPREPTCEQKAALAKFDQMLAGAEKQHVMLLYGVTNSGKTEVYLQAIAKVLAKGKSAIVLVPEISLTPQTVRRFRARFGNELSVMHSGLGERERFEEWNRIDRGEAKIVIGARSALFAPLSNLGLIIVDEEHEGSYKQNETPRYHARDVAVMRGALDKALVILGSATPAAESMENCRSGKYLIAEMRSKVNNQLDPKIHVVDQRLAALNNQFVDPETGEKVERTPLFTPFLIEKIRGRLAAGEQSILFLNRRGYARTLSCDLCGFEKTCPDCSVNMVYSKRHENLSCHWCGRVENAPQRCPQCGDPKIRYSGSGTEKIEDIAAKLFPHARIARMDSDTMRKSEDYEEVLSDFKRGAIDILIGTQMIAKGLHFPNVTLVGVLNADQSLQIPDFRSAERTYQLLTQVAGRAGRGDVPGEVIIQTHNPESEVISAAARGDYEAFAEYDLEARKFMDYPPFSHLIALHFQGENERIVLQYATEMGDFLRTLGDEEIKFTGPEVAPVEKIKGKWRYLLLIRGRKLGAIRRAIRAVAVSSRRPAGVDFYVDVDAQSLI